MLAGNSAYVPPSFESIATTVVGAGGVADVTFSSIPGTYKHLQIRATYTSTDSGTGVGRALAFQFNSDTGSNYARHQLYGDGSSAGSNATTSTTFGAASNSYGSDDIYAVSIIDILDYADANKYTTVRSLGGIDRNGAGELGFRSSLWQNTNAVTSIKLYMTGGYNIDQYSHIALYGVKGA